MIPLLGTHQEKTIIQKDTCTPTFTASVFTTAKPWKQPKWPLRDECHEEDVVYRHNGLLLRHEKMMK